MLLNLRIYWTLWPVRRKVSCPGKSKLKKKNLRLGKVSRKVGGWFASSLRRMSVNHVWMSGSCWDDTFSTDVCDKSKISCTVSQRYLLSSANILGFYIDLILWPRSLLLFFSISQHMFLTDCAQRCISLFIFMFPTCCWTLKYLQTHLNLQMLFLLQR